MKSFQQYLEAIDTGLRGKLEKSFGTSQFDSDQEESVSAVIDLVMQAGANNMPRLMTMLKNLSSRDPSLEAIYDRIDVMKLRSAAQKHTGADSSEDVMSGNESPSDDNVLNKSMNTERMS